MSKLSLIDLGKSFGPISAVADVTLSLRPGEFVSLLGPSGCGKTTTLRMIAGFMKPNAGRIEVDGKVISSPSGVVTREKRGMVRAEGSEIRLRVNAPPDDMHAVGEDVWMEIDPSHIAPVPEPAHP